jgi:hypothetical protein
MQKGYCKHLLLVLLAYVVGYGALLLRTDGFPYVLDNNESFSSLWHASNLYNFDIRKSCGLTDEACSPRPEAHPFVHSHQGNFPRLFAFLLFVLGARGIESQIVLTTLTVGTVAIFFAYHFFTRLAGPRFALIACLFLMTDYVLFAQWQVVTYRVWHSFFIFSSLLCAHEAGRRRWYWVFLTFLNYLCLFYFECVFVVFVTLTSALYAVSVYWRARRTLVRAVAPALAGAVLAVVIFGIQIVSYIGVEGAIKDAAFTLKVRNHAGPGFVMPAEIRDFYDRHAILFWENYVDGRAYLHVPAFCRSFLTFNMQPYTPLLAFVLFILLCGLLGAVLLHRLRWPLRWRARRLSGLERLARSPLGPLVPWGLNVAAFITLSLAWDCLLIALLRDQAYAGAAPATLSLLAARPYLIWVVHAAAGGLCLLVGRCATNRWWGFSRLAWPRVAATTCALLALAWFSRAQHRWYDPLYEPFWNVVRRAWYLRAAAPLAVVTAAGLAALLLLNPRRFLTRADCHTAYRLGRYLACGTIAYIVVYVRFPGYLHTGYLGRYVSFFVFFSNVALAVAFFFLLQFLLRELSRRQWPSRLSPLLAWLLRRSTWPLRPGVSPPRLPGLSLARALALGLVLVFIATYWVRLQALYLHTLPPDAFAFLQRLRTSPYRGASFVANVYAAPIAASTGQWAYLDPLIATGRVQLGKHGYLVERDVRTCLWLADGATNPAYAKPDYILLVRRPDLSDILRRLDPSSLPVGALLAAPFTSASEPQYLQHQVVAHDPSGLDRWVILKADWDYPPYLIPRSAADPLNWVGLDVTTDSSGAEVRVGYRYAHQEGMAEGDTIVRLYEVSQDGESRLLFEQVRDKVFRLPPSYSGNVKASVIPCTSTKSGPESISNTRRIGKVPSLQAPYLKTLPGRADGSFVQVSLGTGSDGHVGEVDYVYGQDENEPECGTLRRLYLEDGKGGLTLLQEVTGDQRFLFPPRLPSAPNPRSGLRVSVTPKTAVATGREYFSQDRIPLTVLYRPYLQALPGPGAPRVKVELHRRKTHTALALTYAFGHPLNVPEGGTRVRLFGVDPKGSLTLLRQENDTLVVLLEPDFRGRVQVSVTPGAAGLSGQEYFSDIVSVGD